MMFADICFALFNWLRFKLYSYDTVTIATLYDDLLSFLTRNNKDKMRYPTGFHAESNVGKYRGLQGIAEGGGGARVSKNPPLRGKVTRS